MSGKVLIVVGAGVLLAAVALLVSRSNPAVRPVAEPSSIATTAREHGESSSELEGVSGGANAASMVDNEVEKRRIARVDEPPAASTFGPHQRTLVVSGRTLGLLPNAGKPRVELHGQPSRGVRARVIEALVGDDGSYSVEWAPYERSTLLSSALELTASHAAHMTVSIPLDLRIIDSIIERDDGNAELHLDIALESACIVRGEVFDRASAPVSDGSMLLVQFKGTTTLPEVVATTKLGPDGRFELSARPIGDCSLTFVSSQHPQMQLALNLAAPGVFDVGRIVIEAGATIDGRVVPASALHPFAGVSVSLLAIGLEPITFQSGTFGLMWSKGTLRTYSRTTRTNDAGAFHFDGLNPGAYALSVNGTPASCTMSDVPGRDMDVIAPAHGVRLEYGSPLLELTFTDGVTVLRRVQVTCSANGSSIRCSSRENGQVLLGAPPNAEIELRCELENYQTKTVRLRAPALGASAQERITLERALTPGIIVCELVLPDGSVCESAEFTLVAVGAEEDDRSRWIGRAAVFDNDHYELRDVAPGEYELTARARSRYDLGHFYQDARASVRVSSGQRTSVRLALRSGGRAEFMITDEDGSTLPARCRIYDSTAQRIEVSFLSIEGTTGWTDRELPHCGPRGRLLKASMEPALPAGAYEARIELLDYRTTTVLFTIVERGVTLVSAKLQRTH